MLLLLLSYPACSYAVETETAELPVLYTGEIWVSEYSGVGAIHLWCGAFHNSHTLSSINNIHFSFLEKVPLSKLYLQIRKNGVDIY